MRFRRTLVSCIGLTVMLLSEERWLIGVLAAEGSRIVFSHLEFDNFEIYVMDADGGNRKNLSNNPVDDEDPDWSPDGTKIAFVSRRTGKYQIYVMDADGTNQIKLTDGLGTKREPDWSPDGQKIAFSVLPNFNHGVVTHIAVMDADGKNRVRFEDLSRQPSWSPDGQRIAFLSRKDGHREIYVIGADGKGLEKVTHDLATKWHPSFSPDGQRIAYWGEEAGSFHIYVVGVDGKNLKKLTHNQENHRGPAWSPDGEAIAYASSDEFLFGAKIHLMTADGEYLKQLSKVRDGTDYQPDISPLGLSVSPTSKTATIWGRLKKRASNLR